MEIDVSKPEGNIHAALTIAKRVLREMGWPRSAETELQKQVLAAESYKEACGFISAATGGFITFIGHDR